MNKTNIEWVKNPDGTQGYTWNPITGCLNGCEYCYARKLANTRLKDRYIANSNVAPLIDGETHWNPFYPRFWNSRIREEFGSFYTGALPKGIFVCDMSDLFGIGVPKAWTRRILNKIGMEYYQQHRFYLLTKQPQNLIKFSPFPDNCWVGVTATDVMMLINATKYLAGIDANNKYISFEPLIDWQVYGENKLAQGLLEWAGIDWIIIGSQTKPYKPPKIEWVREIVEAADKAGISVFLKNNLKPLIVINKDGQKYTPAWANGGYGSLRQEMPK